jgi:RES domain-containing protein
MSTTSVPVSEPKPERRHFCSYSGRIIRMVEAQHRISTDRLTDGSAEQDVLERLVEQVKPTLPPAARSLHHLLATPFRYGYARETRFRRARERPGIFYASENQATAVAETAYWRMRFFAASPGMKLPTTTVEYFAFSVAVGVERALDLTARPLSSGRKRWTDPTNYAVCQRFAASARALDAQLIRYESVRDPEARVNVALMDPAAFREPVPRGERTWHFRFRGERLTAFAAAPSRERYDFSFEQFGLSAP